jgi:small subunit ribosomal protein S1
MNNMYKPEGWLLSSRENKEYLSSEALLIKAMDDGKILESIALYCADGEEEKELHFDLGKTKGIMPQSELEYNKNGESAKDIAMITRVGKAVCFKILRFFEKNGEKYALLSRKEAQKEYIENQLFLFQAGDILDATVTHMEPFGAFLDIGCGIISLMSIDCISVSRISHPKDRFFAGMKIKAAIKSIDRETGRIYMTHKELLGTWKENAELFSIGQTVSGIIRSIEPYGIFIELSPNLAGLAEYRDDVCVGENASVYIKNIIPDKMKVKLVIVDTFPPPEASDKNFDYKINSGRISRWLYSPEESARILETDFSADV